MDQKNDEALGFVLPVDDEGYVIDGSDYERRKSAWLEQGSVRPITVVGNPLLHRECKEVTEFDEDLKQLAADMFATMQGANGVGLAANQIAVDLKIFVYDCPEVIDPTAPRRLGLICNPRLIKAAPEEGTTTQREGCLSVPGGNAPLTRPAHAEIAGKDLHGNPMRIRGGDVFARMLQHETDHLHGRLYLGLLSTEKREKVLAMMHASEPSYAVIQNEG